jgi:hypothetical protein
MEHPQRLQPPRLRIGCDRQRSPFRPAGESSIVSSAVVSRVVMKLLKQERQYLISEHQATDTAIASQQNQ